MNFSINQTQLTPQEIAASVCETEAIQPHRTVDYDIVVVGAGASGVPAAGWSAELGAKTALLQKRVKCCLAGQLRLRNHPFPFD